VRTDDLIGMLATGAGPAPRAALARRVAPAGLLGLLASVALTIGLLGWVPPAVLALPAWWIKFAFPIALAGALGWAAAELGRPASRGARPWVWVSAIGLVVVVLAVWEGSSIAPGGRVEWVLGASWRTCPIAILGLSLPALGAAFWALRGLAPTRPRAAGLAAGLFAGALGAAGYALACAELSMGFVAAWYSLGIALSGGLGAALGPRLLRW
jgi:hypothetical protein